MTLNEIELLRGKEQQFWSRADLSETLNCDQGAGVNTHVLDPGSHVHVLADPAGDPAGDVVKRPTLSRISEEVDTGALWEAQRPDERRNFEEHALGWEHNAVIPFWVHPRCPQTCQP